MKTFRTLIFAAACAFASNTASAEPDGAAAFEGEVGAWEGEVTAVIEGDVIEVTTAEGALQVRIEGVDCPEAGQEFAKISRRFTAQHALRATVRIEETGREGRLRIGRVLLSRGRSLGEELVKSGLAWWDRVNYPSLARFADLEREARDRYAGLWVEDEPVAPWDWRARRAPPADAAPAASPDPAGAASDIPPIIAPSQESLRDQPPGETGFAAIPIIHPTRIR